MSAGRRLAALVAVGLLTAGLALVVPPAGAAVAVDEPEVSVPPLSEAAASAAVESGAGLASALQYTGNAPLDATGVTFPGLQTFDAFQDAAFRPVEPAGVLPADLQAFRCVLLNGMTTAFSPAELTALTDYVYSGGTLVTAAESDAIAGGPDTQVVQNQVLDALGAGIDNGGGSFDAGFHTTSSVVPDAETAGVSSIRYGNTGALSTTGPSRTLVVGEGGQIVVAAQSMGSGTVVALSDMNLLSDRSDTGYAVEDNGVLARNLCGTGGFLGGFLQDEDTGQYVPGVHLAVLRTSDFSLAGGGVTAGAFGQFQIFVEAGSYFVYAIDPSGAHATGFVGAPEVFDIEGLELRNLTVPSTRGAVSGTVTDAASGAGLPGAWSLAIGPTGIAGGTLAGPGGDYTIGGLPPSTYRATWVDPDGGRIQEYSGDSPDYDGATTFPVQARTTTTGIDAALSAAPGPGQVVDVTVGDEHTCALLGDGQVKCWGFNLWGQLGLGDTAHRGDGSGEMGAALPAVDLGTGRHAVQIDAGAFATCAVLDDGTVKCWGSNNGGVLGLGDTDARGDAPGEMGDDLAPVDLGTGRTATVVSVGDLHACALLDDGSVKCWGAGVNGRLGTGDSSSRGDDPGELGDALPPVDLGPGRTATKISAGGAHTCAVLDDATVRCWGAGADGRLGLGDTSDRGDGPGELGAALPAVLLGPGRTATDVAAANAHTCALLDDGSVKCWGFNGDGRLGLGDSSSRGDAPGEMGGALPTVALGTGRTAVEIDSKNHTCARLDDQSLKCWGDNVRGQLGVGDTVARGGDPGDLGDALPTVDLGPERTAVGVATGSLSHTCAVVQDGGVACWGDNQFGALGLGDTEHRGDEPGEMGGALPPTEVPDLGLLSGTVIDAETSAPVPGGLIALLRTSDFSLVAAAASNGAGDYAVRPPPGSSSV